MIQSQTLLFSTIPQATQMHKLTPYSPGAGTLQYNGLGTISSKQVDGAPPEAPASFWEMVWVALISSGWAPMNWMRSQFSLSHSSKSGHANLGGGSVLVHTGWDSGTSTCTHWWRWAFSCLCVLLANTWFGWSFSSTAFSLHDAGLCIIEISPMCQFISGLCSMSHKCPRIIIVQPMLVMWNIAWLEWSLY